MRWALRNAESQDVQRLALETGLPVATARLLAVRGIQTAEQAHKFLTPSLQDLHSPDLMTGLRVAVERLRAAIERGETVLIYGDYDVDGTTAIVILKTAIELCGGQAEYHVPHRIREGYGMRDEVIEQAADRGIRVIISVDTGIRAFAAGETAQRRGIDLIVTDHHLPQANGVPKALAVVNPNQQGCDYPCKSLCGAGVAFKIAQALLEETGRERLLPSFLKMVAIATIADAVPLIGENRVFAKLGLEGLRKPVNAGLRALLANCQLNGSRPLSASDIAFRVAPRLNAAGRMDVAEHVIQLFTEKDATRAADIALRLNQLNGDRQQEEQRILEEIQGKIEASPEMREAYCLVLEGEGWHRGVIGICATRVVERYRRPTLIFSCEDGEAHGSGRSIEAFHLLQALESCPELFTRFGGHAHAVGCTLPVEKIPELRSRLDAFARERLTPQDFIPILHYDAEISLEDVKHDFWLLLQKLEPFGSGNPVPVFVARNAKLVQPPRVLKEKHLKLRVVPGGGNFNGSQFKRGYDALGWRMAERLTQESLLLGSALDLAFTVDYNEHPEFGGVQLNLLDFAPAAAAASAARA
ncbi:MAG TPA: single-stranded-DNA-specific exonuclease RecJ [Candidatus Limnocylindrales bacterium]|nr:single-stranded-DNA-specific exonuclease RecJ [Candidatus Limnocylindrales bacterium]